jgi:hypothetical protein
MMTKVLHLFVIETDQRRFESFFWPRTHLCRTCIQAPHCIKIGSSWSTLFGWSGRWVLVSIGLALQKLSSTKGIEADLLFSCPRCVLKGFCRTASNAKARGEIERDAVLGYIAHLDGCPPVLKLIVGWRVGHQTTKLECNGCCFCISLKRFLHANLYTSKLGRNEVNRSSARGTPKTVQIQQFGRVLALYDESAGTSSCFLPCFFNFNFLYMSIFPCAWG